MLYKHIAPMTMDVWITEFLPRIEAARARREGRTIVINRMLSRAACSPACWPVGGQARARHRHRGRVRRPGAAGTATRPINRELRCLVCQNQTIADSNATLAQDLRREVREMIAAGKTDDEIRDFMIARYGDFVLYRRA